MSFEREHFDTLYGRAEDFRDAGRYADAAVLYERALKTTGGTEERRLWARYWLGVCLKMLGRYTEAIAYHGEVYTEAKAQGHHELTYRSLVDQINSLRFLQRIA